MHLIQAELFIYNKDYRKATCDNSSSKFSIFIRGETDKNYFYLVHHTDSSNN